MRHRMLELAKAIAEKGEHKQHRLGCVIEKSGKVIGVGWNRNKTHPKSLHPFKMVHAEFDAILGVPKWKLTGSIAYVYRQHKSGRKALAKPCKYCYKCLSDAGIQKVLYTTNEDSWSELVLY
jgi:deoxycytidylate deaminase